MAKVAGIFPIGDTGEEFMVAEWHPDPAVIEAQMIQMANAFEDWSVPLAEAREVMIESTQRRFATQTDPNGNPWEPLNEDYRHTKLNAGWPDQILVRTGELQTAATSEAAWFVGERELFFRPEVLPEYGALHQDGTGNEGGHRELFASARAHIESGGNVFTMTEGERRALGSGSSGKALPPRPFIGPDEKAITEIEAIFIGHLIGTVEVPWRDGGFGVGPGDAVMTTRGAFGTLTSIPAFGGGSMVRGARGRFIGVFRP